MQRLKAIACLLLALQNAGASSSSSDRRHRLDRLRRFRPKEQVARVEKYTFQAGSAGSQAHSAVGRTGARSGKQAESSMTNGKMASTSPQKSSSFFQIDEIDRLIVRSTLPLSAVFAIIPLSQALDLFWVNRLGDALAVAGQAAANQVFNSAFWLFAFLPSVTATLVSKSHASGDIEATQDTVCQALLFAAVIACVGTSFMFLNPVKALSSILKEGSLAYVHAKPYLRLRAFSFLPMLVSFVGFSTFRGVMEVQTSVKVAFITNIIAALLDPILIHGLGVGVRGAALATLTGEYSSALIYMKLLSDRNLIKWKKLTRLPAWSSVAPLLKGGAALQVRSFAINLTQLAVARVIQSIDDTGVAPAAHALAVQTFMLGGIVLGGLGMASQTMVPNAMTKKHESIEGAFVNGVPYAQALVRRLFKWGLSFGFAIGLVQLLLLPAILKSSPLPEVREAARVPALIAIAFQGINGVVNVGEGVMMGRGNFAMLSINIVVASLGYFAGLKVFPKTLGLTGVWISLAIFTLIRMIGVLFHIVGSKTFQKDGLDR